MNWGRDKAINFIKRNRKRTVTLLILTVLSVSFQIALAWADQVHLNEGGYGVGYGAYETNPTITIADDATGGECETIGDWDGASKTCTLNDDVSIAGTSVGGDGYSGYSIPVQGDAYSSSAVDGIEIVSDGITLDGNGKLLSTDGTVRYGLVISERTGVTVKNLSMNGDFATNGIYLAGSSSCSIEDNDLVYSQEEGSFGWPNGINMDHSDSNFILRNSISDFSAGLLLSQSNFNTIEDNIISNIEGSGISLTGDPISSAFSDNNELRRNHANHNGGGIGIAGNGNLLEQNEARDNFTGFSIEGDNNVLQGNIAEDNIMYGMVIWGGPDSILRNNEMSGNQFNFDVAAYSQYYEEYDMDIDTSNTIEGRPIYYVVGATGETYDGSTNAGAFYCIACQNTTISGLNLNANNGAGVFLLETTGSTVENITTGDNETGIALVNSSNNVVQNTVNEGNTSNMTLLASDSNQLTSNQMNAAVEAYCPGCKGGVLESGLSLQDSGDNVLRNNSMADNPVNFTVNPWSGGPSGFYNDVDTSNTVDGMPIYYVVGASGQEYDSSTNAGVFYCIDCNDVTLSGLQLDSPHNINGLTLFNSSNTVVKDSLFANSYSDGAYVGESDHIELKNNRFFDSSWGFGYRVVRKQQHHHS